MPHYGLVMTPWNVTFSINKRLCLSYGNKGTGFLFNSRGKKGRIQIECITAFLLRIKDPEIKLRKAVGGRQVPDKHIWVLGAIIQCGLWELFNYALFHFKNAIRSRQKTEHQIIQSKASVLHNWSHSFFFCDKCYYFQQAHAYSGLDMNCLHESVPQF